MHMPMLGLDGFCGFNIERPMVQKQITLRQIVENSLSARKAEYLTPAEVKKFSDHIMDNSQLAVTARGISMCRGSKFGIGEDNKDKNLESIPKYMLFRVGTACTETASLNGMPQRDWQLQSFHDLQSLEANMQCHILMHQEHDTVALIAGVPTAYTIVHDALKPSNHRYSMMRNSISWDTHKPYTLMWQQERSPEIEHFASRQEAEQRLTTLLDDPTTSGYSFNCDGVTIEFTVTVRQYSSAKPNKPPYRYISWGDRGFDDHDDDADDEDDINQWNTPLSTR